MESINIIEKVVELANKHTDEKIVGLENNLNLTVINQIDGIKTTINRLLYGTILAVITFAFAAGLNINRINEFIKTQQITNKNFKEQAKIYECKVDEISDKTLLLHQRLSLMDENTPSPFSSTRGSYSNKTN